MSGKEYNRRFASAEAGTEKAPEHFVAACREAIRRQMPGRFDELFSKLDDALYDLADKSETNSLYTTYFDALQVFRRQRHAILALFLRKLDEERPEPVSGSGHSRPQKGNRAEWKPALMQGAELEETLAVANLISKAESRYRPELLQLRRHLASLRGEENMDVRTDPFEPHRICNAFRLALKPLADLNLSIKLVVYKLFDKQVMDQLGGVYARCRGFAAQQDSTSTSDSEPSQLRGSVQGSLKGAAPPPLRDDDARKGRDPPESARPDTASDSGLGFSDLQRLLRNRRSKDSGGEGRIIVDTDELMSVLQHLQEVIGAGVDTDELRLRLSDELHLGGRGAQGRTLGRVDEDTLDLVFLLFEHILHDDDIPDALKLLIGRLQIPFLKVALLDKTVFYDRHHPARCLLNHLAEVAMGWNDELDGRSPDSVYGRVTLMVDEVVARYDGDSAVLSKLDAELCAVLAREQGEALSRQARVQRELELREHHRSAQHLVRRAIDERLRSGDPVPEAISFLLYDGWQQVLLDAFLREGASGAEWKSAMQTIDHLVWSVQPKGRYEDRRELLRSIPDLLRTLRESLARVSYDQRRLARWFKELQALHIAALHGAGPTPMRRESAARVRDMTVEAPPSRPSDMVDPVDFSGLEAAESEAAGLKPGTWIEVRRDDGRLLRVKLAWRSPQSGVSLFVDRRGRKALELDGKDIMWLQQQGALRLMGKAPILDRAIAEVVQTLKEREKS